MADKTPKRDDTPLAQGDRTLYKELTSGIYAVVRGAALMVGTNLVSLANRLPVDANLQVGDVDVSATNPVPVSSSTTIRLAKPILTVGAYAANDCVGGMLTFANAARETGLGGVIKNLFMVDDAREQDNAELWLFNQPFTSPGNNNPWVLSEPDAENWIGVINLANGTWYDGGGAGSDTCDVELAKGYACIVTSLFGQLVTRGIPTYAAISDLTVKLALLRD